MVLLVAELNSAPSQVSTQVNTASSANGMDTLSSYLRVINTPLLMQYKGKIQVSLHK